MGESRRKQETASSDSAKGGGIPQAGNTLGRRMHVRWDRGAASTPRGRWVFFAACLATAGVSECWVSPCPLEHRSGNAPAKRDVLGRLMLGLLAGDRRCEYVTALRGDAIAAQSLGMNQVVSDDALRRALARIGQSARAPARRG